MKVRYRFLHPALGSTSLPATSYLFITDQTFALIPQKLAINSKTIYSTRPIWNAEETEQRIWICSQHSDIITFRKQQQSESANLRQGESGPDTESEFWVRIRTHDPDDFQNLTGTFLSNDTYIVKFSWRSHQFFQRCELNCGKSPISQCWILQKNSCMWIRRRITSKI